MNPFNHMDQKCQSKNNIKHFLSIFSAIMLLSLSISLTANTHYTHTISKKDTFVTDTFEVKNLDCNIDKSIVQKSLYRQRGIKKVSPQINGFVITYKSNKINADTIIKIIESCGTCENPNDKRYKANKK